MVPIPHTHPCDWYIYLHENHKNMFLIYKINEMSVKYTVRPMDGIWSMGMGMAQKVRGCKIV